ncbi:MAG: hypothetical protein JST85_16075 [Acidobacteria bacterium]|nr:hypothetical protein [Acidobacteriota bacterium]
MNCQEFEQIVAELADDRLASVRARIAAMTHAANCEHCDAQLQAQKALNHGLFAFAAHTADQQPPLQLRHSLRAVFEAQQAVRTAEKTTPNVIRIEECKPVVRRRWTLALAAAAAVIVFAAIVWIWQSPRPTENLVSDTAPTPTVTSKLPAETKPPSNDVAEQTPHVNQLAEVGRGNRQLRTVSRKPANYGNGLAANYIPLSYAAGSATPDQSLVVRVNVPRTTLIAMGLPLSAERGSEMVKADLRVGIDGVPLAIRLIRQ